MTNIGGWVTFREIIDDVMLATGDTADYGQFMRYLNFAIQGYEDLRLSSLPASKPVVLAVDGEMRIVVLPDDCLRVERVGMMYNGRFHEFVRKSDMVKGTTSECGVSSQTAVTDTYERYYDRCYWAPDTENRRLVIDAPTTVTEVTVVYVPTGVKMDGVTYIPRMAAPVIRAYVEWQSRKREPGVPMGERIMYENDYLKELMKFRGLQYDPAELFNELYEHLATGKQY